MAKESDYQSRITQQLGFALKDPNPNIRFLALEGLQLFPGSKECDLIAPLLNDKDRFVKWKAIQVCGVLGMSRTFPVLQKLLSSSDMNTRLFAAYSLGMSGDCEYLPGLLDLAQKEDSPRVRQILVRILYLFGENAPWDFIAKATRDPDVGVRIDTAIILGRLAPIDAACDILINLLEKESNNHVFATAILSLGRFKRTVFVGYFQHSLLHQESRIRANAVEAIGQLHFKTIHKIIEPYLHDPSNRVKANVMAIYLQNGQGEKILSELGKLLESSNRWERSSGAWLAGTYKIASTVPALIKLLHDEEAVVAERSAWALGKIGAKGTFDILKNSYMKANQWTLPYIIKAMGEIPSQVNAESVFKLMNKERSPLLKSQFIDLLAKIKAVNYKDNILKMLTEPDHHVRSGVYGFISSIDADEAPDLLLSGLDDANLKVRAVCAELMIKKGDFRALKALSALLNDSDKLQRVHAAYTLREIAQRTSPGKSGDDMQPKMNPT